MTAIDDHVLRLHAVEKIYGTARNPVPVLRGIDLTIDEGEYVAIVGPSGSGKSTLLNILGCLDQPTKGTYTFVGQDVAQLDDRSLSRVRNRRIGFVFQSFQLVPHLSVLENAELPLFYARVPRRERHRKCIELIERVGLGHRIHHAPTELSGGECQRAAIARALTGSPSLLLADEPTGNLDSSTSAEIMKLFGELHHAGTTMILITHDDDVARRAPRRVTISDGLIASDTRQEIA